MNENKMCHAQKRLVPPSSFYSGGGEAQSVNTFLPSKQATPYTRVLKHKAPAVDESEQRLCAFWDLRFVKWGARFQCSHLIFCVGKDGFF